MWGKGVRASFEIVTGRAKREVLDVKVANAVWRSWEAERVSGQSVCNLRERNIAYLIFLTASCTRSEQSQI